MKQRTANFEGYLAILLWSFSAYFTGLTEGIPPFLLAGITSLPGFLYYVPIWIKNPNQFKNALRQPKEIWLLFFIAMIVYRGLYYSALKLAPIVEANLLNYLWPLFIVLLSIGVDRKKLSIKVLLGALCCFAGVICIGISRKTGAFSFQPGHLLAIAAAAAWAIYSVTTRRFVSAPKDMIGLMQLFGFIIFIALHKLFEPSINITQLNTTNWIGIGELGLVASLGYALWDNAMTYGDRDSVAVKAYYTPLLSTLWLVLFAHANMTPLIWAAAVLIIGGALVARFNAQVMKEIE